MAARVREFLLRTLLVISGSALGLVALFWLLPRLRGENPLRLEPPPCFEVGSSYHHRFRANCAETLNTPKGPVPFVTNEDRLRDRPRAEILAAPSRVLLAGDSVVEGWWLGEEDTLSQRLSSAFPSRRFVNAGLRSTGPLFQASRLPTLLAAYRPRALVYLLNENDQLDDRLACALAESTAGAPAQWRYRTADFDLPAWATWMKGSPGQALRQELYRRRWRDLVNGAAGNACDPCAGLSELQRIAGEAKVPLRVARLEYRNYLGGGPYFAEPGARAVQAECLRALGIRAATLNFGWTNEAERERLFWPGDSHPNPAGMAHLAGLLQRMLEKGGALE